MPQVLRYVLRRQRKTMIGPRQPPWTAAGWNASVGAWNRASNASVALVMITERGRGPRCPVQRRGYRDPPHRRQTGRAMPPDAAAEPVTAVVIVPSLPPHSYRFLQRSEPKNTG